MYRLGLRNVVAKIAETSKEGPNYMLLLVFKGHHLLNFRKGPLERNH